MTISTTIFNMFGHSPIRPLEQHINKANACVEVLLPFVVAIQAGDWVSAEEHHAKIVQYEHEADELKKDLRLHLPKSLLLPVHRGDILSLLNKQDGLANNAKDIAGLMIGRRMTMPDQIYEGFSLFLRRCIEASQLACKAINELDELLETGFRGHEAQLVEEMIVKLDRIEHDTDEMQIAIRKTMYDLETLYPPVDIIFLYKIIEWTGDIADLAQTVGGHLQLLIAR